MLVFFIFLNIYHFVYSQQPSPCPDIFFYEPRGLEEDRWYGVVTLHTNEPLEGVYLRVTLDQPAELLGNWFGDSSTSDNRDFLVRNSNYRLETGISVNVRFFIKYNTAKIVPSVTKIRLNGKVICLAEGKVEEPTTPKLHISQFRPSGSSSSSGQGGSSSSSSSSNHRPNRRPTGSSGSSGHSQTSEVSSNSGTNNYNGLSVTEEANRETSASNGFDFFPGDFNLNVRPQTQRPTAAQSPTKRNPGCGTVQMQPTALISFGQNTTQGQWPWHAALYYTQQAQLLYTCGGTLISENHVLTAAHCVTKVQSNRAIDPKILSVYLGKYSLKKFGAGVQDREVSEIFVHPQYNYSVYFNDIAVLKMERPLEITATVRPCCLWDESVNIDDIENKLGTVVGWGFDQNHRISDTLMMTQMPIVSTIKCIYSNRDFFSQFTFDKNFCAGFRNGTSVCNGDSGGGMVFPKSGTSGRNTVWQIRGIVSVSVALQGQSVCDSSQYIVFTDVAKHLSWIKRTMEQ